ncbi:fimbrial biogenesis chaperone [Mixta intestinalis]|uniref:Putative fimbrial chaperone YadV n=1 Tax=Mixta intestinalis TaxID=1615494 RepID=A0A6P1Q1H3_9GAMM|nr:molecular chaperone [Mixta intestinalis]QHM72413.1 putative fimbrial chaperone YadV [Mixta intestinalis]
MTRLNTLILAFFTALTLPAYAANSVMIWPIDPKIISEDKASELWLENHGNSTTLMQVRIFAWQQISGREQYQTQQQVVASPPIVRIEPGQKQLVRLIKQSAPAAGQEAAYRVVLDEIPTPQQPGENQAGLRFQMRYSVPLFVYGDGLTADAQPQLSWHTVSEDGQRWLEIVNHGAVHARLSKATLNGRELSSGLFGYVLANSSHRWPLNASVSSGAVLAADVNNRSWRSASSTR